MHIKLFSIGPISFYSYGLMIAIGMILAVIISMKRCKPRGLDPDHMFNIGLVGIIAGVIGAKLAYYIVELPAIIKDPSLLLDITNGFVLYGGVILGIVAPIFYCRKKKISFLEYLDTAIPTIPMAQGFGRLGCFCAGCCYGLENHSWFAVTFPESGLAPAGVPLIPTQLISSLLDFLLAGFLFWLTRVGAKRKPQDGVPSACYMLLYSIGRFLVEFLRGDPRGTVGPFSTSQFISIFVCIFAIGWLIIIRRDRKEALAREVEAKVDAELAAEKQARDDHANDLSPLGEAFARLENDIAAEEAVAEVSEAVDAAEETVKEAAAETAEAVEKVAADVEESVTEAVSEAPKTEE